MVEAESMRREIEEFLYLEADLLDRGEFDLWLGLFTDDAIYQMPVRTTHDKNQCDHEFSNAAYHFNETKEMLDMRIRRLGTKTAWAESPPSRTRHFVSNLRIARLDDQIVKAYTNLLLYRNRGDSPEYDLLSAQREDQLIKKPDGWRLTQRLVFLDQATIGTLNLSVFL